MTDIMELVGVTAIYAGLFSIGFIPQIVLCLFLKSKWKYALPIVPVGAFVIVSILTIFMANESGWFMGIWVVLLSAVALLIPITFCGIGCVFALVVYGLYQLIERGGKSSRT